MTFMSPVYDDTPVIQKNTPKYNPSGCEIKANFCAALDPVAPLF